MYPLYPLLRDTFEGCRDPTKLLTDMSHLAYRRGRQMNESLLLTSEPMKLWLREYKDVPLDHVDHDLLELCEFVRQKVPNKHWYKLFPSTAEEFLGFYWRRRKPKTYGTDSYGDNWNFGF